MRAIALVLLALLLGLGGGLWCAAVTGCGSLPPTTATVTKVGVLATHEEELDRCMVLGHEAEPQNQRAVYTACADEVDARFGLKHDAGADAKGDAP